MPMHGFVSAGAGMRIPTVVHPNPLVAAAHMYLAHSPAVAPGMIYANQTPYTAMGVTGPPATVSSQTGGRTANDILQSIKLLSGLNPVSSSGETPPPPPTPGPIMPPTPQPAAQPSPVAAPVPEPIAPESKEPASPRVSGIQLAAAAHAEPELQKFVKEMRLSKETEDALVSLPPEELLGIFDTPDKRNNQGVDGDGPNKEPNADGAEDVVIMARIARLKAEKPEVEKQPSLRQIRASSEFKKQHAKGPAATAAAASAASHGVPPSSSSSASSAGAGGGIGALGSTTTTPGSTAATVPSSGAPAAAAAGLSVSADARAAAVAAELGKVAAAAAAPAVVGIPYSKMMKAVMDKVFDTQLATFCTKYKLQASTAAALRSIPIEAARKIIAEKRPAARDQDALIMARVKKIEKELKAQREKEEETARQDSSAVAEAEKRPAAVEAPKSAPGQTPAATAMEVLEALKLEVVEDEVSKFGKENKLRPDVVAKLRTLTAEQRRTIMGPKSKTSEPRLSKLRDPNATILEFIVEQEQEAKAADTATLAVQRSIKDAIAERAHSLECAQAILYFVGDHYLPKEAEQALMMLPAATVHQLIKRKSLFKHSENKMATVLLKVKDADPKVYRLIKKASRGRYKAEGSRSPTPPRKKSYLKAKDDKTKRVSVSKEKDHKATRPSGSKSTDHKTRRRSRSRRKEDKSKRRSPPREKEADKSRRHSPPRSPPKDKNDNTRRRSPSRGKENEPRSRSRSKEKKEDKHGRRKAKESTPKRAKDHQSSHRAGGGDSHQVRHRRTPEHKQRHHGHEQRSRSRRRRSHNKTREGHACRSLSSSSGSGSASSSYSWSASGSSDGQTPAVTTAASTKKKDVAAPILTKDVDAPVSVGRKSTKDFKRELEKDLGLEAGRLEELMSGKAATPGIGDKPADDVAKHSPGPRPPMEAGVSPRGARDGDGEEMPTGAVAATPVRGSHRDDRRGTGAFADSTFGSDGAATVNDGRALDAVAAAPASEIPPAMTDHEFLEWLKGLDGGRGSLVQYFAALKQEFDADLSQIAVAKLDEPVAAGLLGNIDPCFFEAVGVKPIGHRLLFAKGIMKLVA